MTDQLDTQAGRPLEGAASAGADGLSRRDLLKAGTLGLVAGWDSLIANHASLAASQSQGADDGPVPLLFDEPADRPVGVVPWPVTVGVPFANGVLSSLEGLSIAGPSGAVPAQFSKALDWRCGARTISWVHCDFQTRLGQGLTPALHLHRASQNPPPSQALTVREENGSYVIDTGAIRFQCSKTAFNLFDSFSAGETSLVRSSSLYWKDTQGNVYEGKHVVSEVAVEQSGPLRAVIRYDGWYQSGSGARKLRYSVWLHAFAGVPYVRIYNKLIWTENLTLYVSIDPASGILTTCGLFADRSGEKNNLLAHGWATGDEVRWAYSHSDIDEQGANQYFDNTSETGSKTVVLPKVADKPLDRETIYYVRVRSPATLTLHRTRADAQNNARPLRFLDKGSFSEKGVTYGGRHYLQAQNPVLAEWGLKLDLAAPATEAFVGIAGEESPSHINLTAVKSVTALQSEAGAATLTPGVGPAQDVDNLAGWAAARFASGAGLAVAVKGLAEQTPKELLVDARTLWVKLWGGAPMSLAEQDRVPSRYVENGYPKEWLAFSGEPNPVGIAKTHEIWVWPAQSVPDNRLINDLVQRPVACCPDPQHSCASDYLLDLRAASRTPREHQYIETALENSLRYVTSRDPQEGDFDEWNFGDLRLYRNGPFRTWDNGGYNCSDLFWWQWYRTGKRFFLEEGINNARHVMDVDTTNHSQTITGSSTYQRIAGRTHNYATLQWAWPIPYSDLFTDHPSYLLLCWLMTGYEVARSVLEIKCAQQRASGYGDPGDLSKYRLETVTREQYGAARPKFVYHEFTGEEQFYRAGRNWLQLAMNAQAASKEANAKGSRLFPNNNFWGFFFEGFLYAHRYAGESAVLGALAQIVDDFAVSPTSQYDAPNWKCTVPAPRRMSRSNYSLLAFAAAYKHTADVRYLAYAVDRIMRQSRTIQSARETLPGFDSFAGVMSPVFIRSALTILGAWSDAGFPAAKWVGNLPFFSSRPIASPPWSAQLTMWVKKPADVGGHIRLVFKDGNLTPLETPGRVQAVVLDPTGVERATTLSAEQKYPVQFSGTTLALNVRLDLNGTPAIHFATTGTLPKPLDAAGVYYTRILRSKPTTRFSIHSSAGDAARGAGAIKLEGGSGTLSLVTAKTISDAGFSLPAAGPAGAYRIQIQSEGQLFRLSPATNLPGLVVELPNLADLAFETSLGPAEYYFHLAPGRHALTLTAPHGFPRFVQPVAILDSQNKQLGFFPYSGEQETAAEVKISPDHARQLLTLAKGFAEVSPWRVDELPTLRLDGAQRYVAVTPSQWFSPLGALDKEVAAFWTLEEPDGTRHDATPHGRHLTEFHGPIESTPEGSVGKAAQFVPPGNSWLSSNDPVFAARSSFTVWGWARLDNLADTRYLFVKGGDLAAVPASCEWALYASPAPSGRLYFQVRTGRKFAFTPGVSWLPDRTWHFVIAWYDFRAKTIHLQIDGGAVVTQKLAAAINVGQGPFSVGGCGANIRGWIGQIDAVGFASAVLTEFQRNLLYNGGSGLQYPF